ncbi:MAG TPA: NapC/NirT family cytochrome c [Symbiobacteriaceae bacterium]|nr:NapC/NirT family cytochrome c [Symbiobacteriaceae bacterium]
MRRWGWILGIFVLIVAAAAFTYPLVATANDDVGFCLSCHVMDKQGHSYETSFHAVKQAATCSDCHTGSLPQKYMDGVRHITANVTGNYPEEIHIRAASREVVAGQCYSCHADKSLHARTKAQKGQNCLDCHLGHDPRPIQLPGVSH